MLLAEQYAHYQKFVETSSRIDIPAFSEIINMFSGTIYDELMRADASKPETAIIVAKIQSVEELVRWFNSMVIESRESIAAYEKGTETE